MTEKWYEKTAQQVISSLGTSSDTGLDTKEIRKRLREDGINDIYPTPKRSFNVYIKHLLFDYTSLLMLITLIIAGVFQDAGHLSAMFIILITYYVVAIATYVHSQKVLENVGTTVLPNVKVLRNGKLYMIKQKHLVRGDIFFISTGDIVPCDARLIEARGLEVLEVNVTSVPHAAHKDAKFIDYHDIAPAQQKNMLFASSIITRGTARCVCCEIGEDTLVCKLKRNIVTSSPDNMEVFSRMASFCRSWTLLMMLFTLGVTVLDLFVSKSGTRLIYDSFMTGLSLSVASMSEFFTAFAYIILACGIYSAYDRKKDINRGALIKNTAKLEILKDISCLIVPKEAAFHIGSMSAERVYANGDVYSAKDHGYKRNAARVLRYALISTGLYGSGQLIQRNQSGNNIYTAEEEAIISACEACDEYNIDLETKYPILQHVSKGQLSRFDTTLVMYEYRFVVALRGDFRAVLPLCRYYTEDSRVHEMTNAKMSELVIEAEKLTRENYRVVAIATRDTVYNNLKRLSACQSELTFEGFIAFKEPILPDLAKNIARCEASGIKIIMTTSDVTENNIILADSLGIIGEEKTELTGMEISRMNEGLLRANVEVCRLYQGLNLAQKRLIVRYLQERGEKVGYLCSELDEIILMKESDVGFSQSITLSENASGDGVDLEGRSRPIRPETEEETRSDGCEALKFVSDIVISEADKDGTGGFNAILGALLSSRSIYANLSRMLKYMFTSQIARLVIAVLSVIIGTELLTPIQIMFMGLAVDFGVLLVIAFERPTVLDLKRSTPTEYKLLSPIKDNFFSIILGALWAAVTLLSSVIMSRLGIIPHEMMSSCVFISSVVSQVVTMIAYKREGSIFSRGIRISGALLTFLFVIISVIALMLLIPSFGAVFSVLRFGGYYVFIGVAIPPVVLLIVTEIYKLIKK